MASLFRSPTRSLSAVRVLLQPHHQRIHTTRRLALQNIFETHSPDDPNSPRPLLSVAKLTARGFHLNDDLLIPGGVVFLDGRAFLWDVDPPKGDGSLAQAETWKGWKKEKFKVFEAVVPRPEILLLGTGQRVIPPPQEIRDYISSLGIQLDVMDSRNAASTFNMLAEEGRTVAAALCPMTPVNPRTGGRR